MMRTVVLWWLDMTEPKADCYVHKLHHKVGACLSEQCQRPPRASSPTAQMALSRSEEQIF